MIGANPKFGHVICRCEHVTEGEIVEAIRRGAHTMDAVKHLTRAGMGRCQGGFCCLSVLKLLASEIRLSPTEVTKQGEGSLMIRERPLNRPLERSLNRLLRGENSGRMQAC